MGAPLCANPYISGDEQERKSMNLSHGMTENSIQGSAINESNDISLHLTFPFAIFGKWYIMSDILLSYIRLFDLISATSWT